MPLKFKNTSQLFLCLSILGPARDRDVGFTDVMYSTLVSKL